MHNLLQWLRDGKWDTGASVLGVLVSIVGFAFTLVQVARSKTAAQKAEEAAAGMRDKLGLQTVETDLNTLTAEIDEMKQLHRLGYWTIMPGRYAAVRRKLAAVKANCPMLTKAQKSSIVGVIAQFRDIEDLVEQAIATNGPPKDVAGLNKLAAEQADKLSDLLVSVQQEMKK